MVEHIDIVHISRSDFNQMKHAADRYEDIAHGRRVKKWRDEKNRKAWDRAVARSKTSQDGKQREGIGRNG